MGVRVGDGAWCSSSEKDEWSFPESTYRVDRLWNHRVLNVGCSMDKLFQEARTASTVCLHIENWWVHIDMDLKDAQTEEQRVRKLAASWMGICASFGLASSGILRR